VVVVACGDSAAPLIPIEGRARVLTEESTLSVLGVDTLVRDLVVPWGLAVTPEGGVYIGERTGRISFLAPDATSAVPWTSVEVYAEEPEIGPETGLLGLAIDPDAEGGRALYAVATRWRTSGDREGATLTRLWRRVSGAVNPILALRYANSVLRLEEAADGMVTEQVLVPSLPTAFYHAGGAITLGPDAHLYVSVGDALLPDLARDAHISVGKILRFRRDGSVPDDNPFGSEPTWARGLRNTQALAWLPDGALLGLDHGPSGMDQEGGRLGMDELNVLRPGGDYGWPDLTGWQTAEGTISPTWVWETAIAPGGLALLCGADGSWSGHVLVAGLRGQLQVLRLRQEQGSWTVAARTPLLNGRFGRIRSVATLPDGRVLVTTSNRDARGVPRPGDDLLLALRIGPSAPHQDE
jgi:glucose/arabinose dehydrogenase